MSVGLAKNTLYLTAASVGQKILSFVYFLLIARIMMPENTGAYFIALSLLTIFSVIADFGITPVVIRETAKHPEETAALVRRALGLKLPFILLSGVGVLLFTWFLNYDPQILRLVLFALAILVADAFSLLFYGVLRGLHQLQFESLGIFIGQSLTVLIGMVVLFTQPSLTWLVIALVAGSIFNMLFSASRVVAKFGIKILRPSLDRRAAGFLLKVALPFALANIFVKVYSYVDSIFISKFISTEAVGVYSVAYKFTYAFQFLPMAFVAALYPSMSEAVAHAPEKLTGLLNRAFWYLALLAVPVVGGLWALAPEVISLTGVGYEEAVVVLQVLIIVLLPIFLDFPIGSLLNAADKQATKTVIMGLTMVVNVLANVLLIPIFGIMGAAYAALLSFWFMFLAGLYFIPKIIYGYKFRSLIITVIPIIFSGIVMAAFVFFIKKSIGLLPVIPFGAAVYFMMLLLTGSLKKKHFQEALALFKHDKNYNAPVASDN